MNTVVGIAMPAASDKQLSDEQSRVVAALVLEELARRRLSRRRLADQAKISVSTLEKVLACRRPFTLATMVRLEEALGVSLRQNGANGSQAQSTVSSLASLRLLARRHLFDAAALLRRAQRRLRLSDRAPLGRHPVQSDFQGIRTGG